MMIGKNNRIYTGRVVGNEPQDLKFKGEKEFPHDRRQQHHPRRRHDQPGDRRRRGETRIGNKNLITSLRPRGSRCPDGEQHRHFPRLRVSPATS